MPDGLRRVVTPLIIEEWERCLQDHRDRKYRQHILAGLRYGFRVGFQYEVEITSAQTNMQSAIRNQEVVDKYLQKEVRVVGPLKKRDVPGVHVSRFGVIEKPHQPGKYRLIVDLSHPEGGVSMTGLRLRYAP